MKSGGLYRRETPDAPAELVERTRSADEQDTPEGRSGTAREAPSTGSGSEGLVQDSEGLHAAAPHAEQAPAADADQAEPSVPAPSTRTRKGG
jgi:hypothetical protein